MRRHLRVIAASAIFCLGAPAIPAWAAPPPLTEQALRVAATDPAAKSFYERAGWRPAWDSRDERALVAALGEARRHGIDSARYLAELERASSPAAREAALTRVALAYGRVLAFGAVNPETLFGIYTVDRAVGDLNAGLTDALRKDAVGSWLESLAPADPEYQALSRAYVAASGGDEQPVTIPAGKLIKPGDRDPRVPAIAEALARRGFPATAEREDPTLWTPALAAALSSFQAARRIEADGIVGPRTIQALTAGSADRARQLAVNLERRRWLSRNPAARRIDVNSAAAFLEYWKDGEVAHRARVVTGKPSTPTPQLGSTMTRLVVNPPWNVPTRIAREEILPRGRAYLQRQNMYVTNGRVVQRPGPGSALGLVKFDLDNPYAIYLHDTPSKSFFQSAERHRSHGCVRVQDAVEFARMLAREDGRDGEFDEKLAAGETATVDLTDIPVRLLYHTAWLAEDGAVAYAPDDYGFDAKVAEALGLGGGARPAAAASDDGDTGP